MSNARAVRYRRLALIEQDNEKAELLRLIADDPIAACCLLPMDFYPPR